MSLRQQKKRKIPLKPTIDLPKRKILPLLGKKTRDMDDLDALRLSAADKFENKAITIRNERESAGIGDRFAEIQPMTRPLVDKNLLGKRLDVCFEYELEEGGNELRWCQGK